MESAKCIGVRGDQIRAETIEHGRTVIATPKFAGCDVQERAHMSAKALWRTVVEMVRDVRDGEARVFKEPSSPDESCHSEITFRCWRPRSKEAAHQRTWSDVQKLGELANISN